ncbi:hypothetical protein [Antrihabitans cavernicola]|uniref:Uncharacterized protein n=1 Tax=Antrihabitans cavernicola TaxID=2495913 RepID=A0A5A7SEC3_9NOCA|nr:hypothetical protein [Spelaeibacter cavernicola]KAA0024438.1 hypothetical protein FOY51_00245 [Spelaeibacter cavernicola]
MKSIPFTIAVLFGAFFTITDGGFGWIHNWFAWFLYVVVVGLLLLIGRRMWVAAGASWLQYGKATLDTYNLVSIEWKAAGASRVLDLVDVHGVRVRAVPVRELQENQALWDLVYNGILHSAASGKCDVSDRATMFLKIPRGLGHS